MAIVKIVPMPGPSGEDGTDGGTGTNPKIWNAPNNVEYSIHQKNGGIQVETSGSSTLTDEVSSLANYSNQTSINLVVGETTNQLLSSIASGETNLRVILISDGINFTKNLRNPVLQGGGPVVGTYIWNFTCDLNLILSENTGYGLTIEYGGSPVLWWNADDLGIAQNLNDFRGAKIDYHAYVTDAGTMIGTIYIAHDTSDFYITHIETSSGGSDLGTVNLWYRKTNTYEDGRKIYLYRTDGEAVIHKIQWTAQVYYASELWD